MFSIMLFRLSGELFSGCKIIMIVSDAMDKSLAENLVDWRPLSDCSEAILGVWLKRSKSRVSKRRHKT